MSYLQRYSFIKRLSKNALNSNELLPYEGFDKDYLAFKKHMHPYGSFSMMDIKYVFQLLVKQHKQSGKPRLSNRRGKGSIRYLLNHAGKMLDIFTEIGIVDKIVYKKKKKDQSCVIGNHLLKVKREHGRTHGNGIDPMIVPFDPTTNSKIEEFLKPVNCKKSKK